MRALVLVLTLAAVLAPAVLETVPAAAQTPYARHTLSGDTTRQGEVPAYRFRGRITVPRSWRQRTVADRLALRFGPIGSCRIDLRLRAGVAIGDEADAAERAQRLAPGTGRALLDEGSRRTAAFRVARPRGSTIVVAALVRPAPSVRTRPAAGRVWLQVVATARPDPRVECHSGGPRTVAAELGSALASAAIGGFEL
jgi:hypothetical protein